MMQLLNKYNPDLPRVVEKNLLKHLKRWKLNMDKITSEPKLLIYCMGLAHNQNDLILAEVCTFLSISYFWECHYKD